MAETTPSNEKQYHADVKTSEDVSSSASVAEAGGAPQEAKLVRQLKNRHIAMIRYLCLLVPTHYET